jgi:hypothetical protein
MSNFTISIVGLIVCVITSVGIFTSLFVGTGDDW